MQGIGSTITNTLTSAQQFILPALLLMAIAVGGYMYMVGDHKGARTWITGGLIGAAIVLGAQTIAALVTGAAHGAAGG
jgi:hypothetical protein